MVKGAKGIMIDKVLVEEVFFLKKKKKKPKNQGLSNE
jgi:hypothetical protein